MPFYIKNFSKIFKDAIFLDVFDLNYAKSSETMNYHIVLQNNPQMIKVGYFTRIVSFIYHFLLSFKTVAFLKIEKEFELLFFLNSINQRNSFSFYDKLNYSNEMLGVEVKNTKNFPIFYSYIISFLFIPLVLFNYLRATEYQKKSFKYGIDDYLLVYGFYIHFRYFLIKHNVKMVFLSNDHSILPRIARKAASDTKKVKTIFIPHASASSDFLFPKLEFDIVFLEGEDALEKYNRSGISNSQIFLIGIPKFDNFFNHINKNTTFCSIGIAASNIDDFVKIETITSELAKLNNMKLFLRPHPGEKRLTEYKNLVIKTCSYFSDSRIEASFEFLKNIDLLIAGDSNILLEAALLNVFPLRYNFDNKNTDNYGFIKGGLIDSIYNTPQDLLNYLSIQLEQKPSVRHKAQYYCATIDTEFDGKALELLNYILDHFIKEVKINENKFKKNSMYKNLKNVYVPV